MYGFALSALFDALATFGAVCFLGVAGFVFSEILIKLFARPRPTQPDPWLLWDTEVHPRYRGTHRRRS